MLKSTLHISTYIYVNICIYIYVCIDICMQIYEGIVVICVILSFIVIIPGYPQLKDKTSETTVQNLLMDS